MTTTQLLVTKFYVPPPRPKLVSRSRLLRRLDEGLRLGRKLTLVSAPAGFGKTTLVSEWIAGSGRPTAWLSLDEGDNDPVRFLTYFVVALQKVNRDLGRGLLGLLGSPRLPSPESLVTVLVNDIAAVEMPFTFVLDDYQLIRSAPIHDALSFLLDHQPPQMHLVIITRGDPPLPLPRLRVRDQVTEIREGDLRFTEEEAAAFLSQTLGLTLDAGTIAALESRTEGWIAGLQLAALSMRGRTAERMADFVAAFSGSDRHVIDYLADEVLARQPGEVRDFLCQTGILDHLTAPLCDALLARDDSEAVLKRLEQENLFLVPLDERREWYRYHRLFVGFAHHAGPRARGGPAPEGGALV